MKSLTARYTTHQIMDMIFLAGCYDLLGIAIKSFDIPAEDTLAELHEEVKRAMLADH